MLRDGELLGAITSPPRGPAVHRQSDRAARDLRRPGRHRHRERRACSRSCRRERDLTEALEQQTATSEILQRHQPARRPTSSRCWTTWPRVPRRFCGADDAVDLPSTRAIRLRVAAHHGPIADPVRPRPSRSSRERSRARACSSGGPFTSHDISGPRPRVLARAERWRRRVGYRTICRAAAARRRADRRDHDPAHRRPARSRDKQIELLETFADQAVIAIENVRLFTELQARNRELTEALEQQTATSEILRVISQLADRPAAGARHVVESAARLCDADVRPVYLRATASCHRARRLRHTPTATRVLSELPDPSPSRGTLTARAASGAADHPHRRHPGRSRVPRWRSDAARPAIAPCWRVRCSARGSRSGVIVMRRATTSSAVHRPADRARSRPSPTRRSSPSRTSRLFKELEDRNRDLTEALEQQTATGEILRVISQLADRSAARARRVAEMRRGCATRSTPIILPVRRTSCIRAASRTWPIAESRRIRHAAIDREVGVRTRGRRPANDPRRTTSRPTRMTSSDPEAAQRAIRQPDDAGRAAAARGQADRRDLDRAGPRCGPSRRSRSSCWRPSPTRPSSPSRTSACSRSWRHATAS